MKQTSERSKRKTKVEYRKSERDTEELSDKERKKKKIEANEQNANERCADDERNVSPSSKSILHSIFSLSRLCFIFTWA